jgi:hypothetical protein
LVTRLQAVYETTKSGRSIRPANSNNTTVKEDDIEIFALLEGAKSKPSVRPSMSVSNDKGLPTKAPLTKIGRNEKSVVVTSTSSTLQTRGRTEKSETISEDTRNTAAMPKPSSKRDRSERYDSSPIISSELIDAKRLKQENDWEKR